MKNNVNSNLDLNLCQYDAGLIFRGAASGVMIDGYDKPSPNVPALDSDYAFADWQSDIVAWRIFFPKQPIYIFGPAGCGKTSGLKQIAARINYPVYEVTGYDSMQPVDLEGCQTLAATDGGATTMQWLYGPLAKAMREGALFIFNEIDMASPASLVALNTILDGAPLTIELTGETITPAPGFMFAATGNTNGSGDATGNYTGVNRQNFALQDRFIMVEATYMSEETERALLMRKAPSLPAGVFDHIMSFAKATRFADGNDADFDDSLMPITTRALLRWVKLAEVYAPAAAHGVNVLEKSFMLAFGNARDKGQQLAYKELLQRTKPETRRESEND